MTDHWWEAEKAPEEAEANAPWWAPLEPQLVPCPYCHEDLRCPLCVKNQSKGCYQCGFTTRCPLCRGKGEIVNPD